MVPNALNGLEYRECTPATWINPANICTTSRVKRHAQDPHGTGISRKSPCLQMEQTLHKRNQFPHFALPRNFGRQVLLNRIRAV
jgi:hypothetical protein